MDVQRMNVDRHLSKALRGISMKHDSMLRADSSNLRDRGDRTDLIVRHHHRHKSRLSGYGVVNMFRVDTSVLIAWDIRDPKTVALESSADIEHRLVFGRDSDYVISFGAERFGNSFEREIVCLGRAARENNFFGFCVNA